MGRAKVTPVAKVYRGPTQYLVMIPSDDGEVEPELKTTREEAESFNRDVYERF